MPRTKETRNYSGSILKKNIVKDGRKQTIYLARKRYFDPALGKYRDKTQRCASHAAAKLALQNLETDVVEQLTKEDNLMQDATTHQLIKHFEQNHVKPAIYIGSRKVAGYEQNLNSVRYILGIIKKEIPNIRVRSITYEHCRKFAEKLAVTKDRRGNLPAASTVNKKLSILRKLFTVAIQNGWLEVNPFSRGVPLIQKSAEASRDRILTFEEEARLIAELYDGPRDHLYKESSKTHFHKRTKKNIQRAYLLPYVLLALDTAMRRGEIYNLQWWQVDLDNLVIYLTKEAARKTKGKKEGTLPMTARLYEMFHQLKEASPNTGDNDAVLGKIDFKRSWNNACTDAGIEGLRFHDLRATGATRMLMAGVSDALARKVTRHSREETLRKHYTRIDIVNAQSIGAKLDLLIETENGKIEVNPDSKVNFKGKPKTPKKKEAA